MSVTRWTMRWWMADKEESREAVWASEFDACAKAAVEMAYIIQWRLRTANKLSETLPDYLRAQAVIDQYRGKP